MSKRRLKDIFVRNILKTFKDILNIDFRLCVVWMSFHDHGYKIKWESCLMKYKIKDMSDLDAILRTWRLISWHWQWFPRAHIDTNNFKNDDLGFKEEHSTKATCARHRPENWKTGTDARKSQISMLSHCKMLTDKKVILWTAKVQTFVYSAAWWLLMIVIANWSVERCLCNWISRITRIVPTFVHSSRLYPRQAFDPWSLIFDLRQKNLESHSLWRPKYFDRNKHFGWKCVLTRTFHKRICDATQK